MCSKRTVLETIYNTKKINVNSLIFCNLRLVFQFLVTSPFFFSTSLLESDLNKVHMSHLVDRSLKFILIYKVPSSFFLLFCPETHSVKFLR